MAYGTLQTDVLQTSTGVFNTLNAYTGIAKAWVNFNGGNGNTAGAINGSFNVSSITVNTTGTYTINFTTAMTNANYAPVGTVNYANAGTGSTIVTVIGTATISSCIVFSVNSSTGTLINVNFLNYAFLGT
jgi:hypothetical protein